MKAKAFLDRLALCIKEKGLNRTTFAKDFGIAESTIRNWIRNDYIPPADMVYKLANYYGVPMEYLIAGKEAELDDTDFLILLKIKKLSAEQKKMLLVVADSLITQEKD